MDKEFLFRSIKSMAESDLYLQKEYLNKINSENFLKEKDEVFTCHPSNYRTTNFIVLKELTEKMRKINENFLYAFEIINSTPDGQAVSFGFLIKSNEEENTYVKFYANNLEDLIGIYGKKETQLSFIEIKFVFNGDEFKITSDDIFSTGVINHFKTKFYYETFKNEYLDHYLTEYNLRIKNLVNKIFY